MWGCLLGGRCGGGELLDLAFKEKCRAGVVDGIKELVVPRFRVRNYQTASSSSPSTGSSLPARSVYEIHTATLQASLHSIGII
jgi:hypothetical protein